MHLRVIVPVTGSPPFEGSGSGLYPLSLSYCCCDSRPAYPAAAEDRKGCCGPRRVASRLKCILWFLEKMQHWPAIVLEGAFCLSVVIGHLSNLPRDRMIFPLSFFLSGCCSSCVTGIFQDVGLVLIQWEDFDSSQSSMETTLALQDVIWTS